MWLISWPAHFSRFEPQLAINNADRPSVCCLSSWPLLSLASSSAEAQILIATNTELCRSVFKVEKINFTSAPPAGRRWSEKGRSGEEIAAEERPANGLLIVLCVFR